MKPLDQNTRSVLAPALGHVFWGFSYLFTRTGQAYALPTQLLAHRFTLAFLLLNIGLLFGKGSLHFQGKKVRPLLLLCICELSCFFFESYGLYYTNATISGIFMAASPIAAIALSAVFLKEYPTRSQAIFCLLPIAGVILITLAGNSLGTVSALGIFFLLLYCFSSGAYKTVNRSASDEFTPFERTYALIGCCTVTFSLVSLIQLKGDLTAYFAPFTHLPFTLSVLALCIFCSIAANMLVNYGSGSISVTKMATLGSITTVCSTFAGIVFLHEPFNADILLGAALILVGVWLVTTRGK